MGIFGLFCCVHGRAEAQVMAALLRGSGAGGLSRQCEAQRSVRLVAEGAAGTVIYADEHDDAAHLVKPQLVEAIAVHLLLHVNAFVQLLCSGEGRRADLFPLRPERVSIEADGTGWPLAYVY